MMNILQNSYDLIFDNLMNQESEIGEILYLAQENNHSANIQRAKLFNMLQKIFEPYFTTKINGEGAGMSLYVSKITIETNMHGSISFHFK